MMDLRKFLENGSMTTERRGLFVMKTSDDGTKCAAECPQRHVGHGARDRDRTHPRRWGMTWRSMEDAPKDGTRVLLRLDFGHGDVRVYGAQWDTQRHHARPLPYWRWDIDVFGRSMMRSILPTHWQPLPSTEVES